MHLRRSRIPLLLLEILLLWSAPALGQTVTGTLVDGTTGRPVAGATVLLVDSAGAARAGSRTDAAGAWSLRAPRRGATYSIRAQKAGFSTVETGTFVAGSERIVLGLSTRPELVMLEEVTAQRLAYDAFMSRRERRMGIGYTPEEIARRMERIRPADTARLLWGLTPGMAADPVHGVLRIPRGAGRARGCVPTLVLDGKLYDPPRAGAPLDINDVVPVWEIRAVEIYNDPAFTPSELPVYMPAELKCGVVAIWTYRALGEG